MNRLIKSISFSKSLGLQLTALIVLCTTIVLGCFGWYRYSEISQSLETDLKEHLNSSGEQICVSVATPLFNFDDETVSKVCQAAMLDKNIIAVYIFEDDQIRYSYTSDTQAADDSPKKPFASPNSIKQRFKVTYDQNVIGHAMVWASRDVLDETLHDSRTSTLYQIVIINTVLIAVITVILHLRFIVPIKIINNASTKFAEGKLDEPIDISGKDELGSLAQSLMTMRDSIKKQIVNLNQKNKEIKEAKNRAVTIQVYLKKLIDTLPSVIIGVDDEVKITQWNLEAEKQYGLAMDDAIGMRLDNVLPVTIIKAEDIIRTMKSDTPLCETKVIHALTTGDKYFDLLIHPFHDEQKMGAVIRIDNITKRKQIEEVMIQTEKMMSVGGLAAGMAHEINNPLGAILQSSQNIVRRTETSVRKNRETAEELGISLEDVHNYLDKRGVYHFINGIREAGIRAASIVKNMLLFSSQSSTAFCEEDLPELIDSAVELAGSDYDLSVHLDFKTISIQREYEVSSKKIMCRKSEIKQVLLNLLKNGAYAMSEVKRDEFEPKLTIRYHEDSDNARIEIEDNGMGISSEVKKRIFEPFFTTKPVGIGSGLGLSVSYMIVTKNHNGTLEVESEEGKGTRFIISLPFIQPETHLHSVNEI